MSVRTEAAALIRKGLAAWGGNPDLWCQGRWTDKGDKKCLNTVLGYKFDYVTPDNPLAVARKAIVDQYVADGGQTGWSQTEIPANYDGTAASGACVVNNILKFEELTALMEKVAANLEASVD